MTPSIYIREIVRGGESYLSLCAGIGLEIRKLTENMDITAVDLTPEYLDVLKERQPFIKTVVADAVKYITDAPDESFDIVAIIDGLEHLTKAKGHKVLEECKRVARRKVLVFTPQGFVENDIHATWGHLKEDKHQLHLSGWDKEELFAHGFELAYEQDAVSGLGDDYKEAFYTFSKADV